MAPGRSALPSGVVTFLLTDIEGSTALWDTDPDGMRRALELHDALFEAGVEGGGGNLLKARGEGDSTFSVFSRPTAAVTAALEIRRALEAADWPDGCRPEVRFAIHTGEVSERDGDYYGSAVNRAGRLRSLAVGGQILVSQAVTEVVADHLPPDASLVDLGEQELRGLSRPERVWALLDAARPVREALGGLCPYMGLLAFQPEDADVFFGREALVSEVLARLMARHFLVVVGASGSGKSSLARAGVVGALRRGALPGSEQWRSVIVTPGEDPSARLAAELGGPTPDEVDADALVRAAGDGRLVLVIDQMEELFTSCRDPAARERFVATVLDATTASDGRVVAIGALRADFYGHCASIPRLAAPLSDATLLLGPMDDRELTRAIEAPAQVAGLRLEPGLVELILRDLAREPGSLPLLSHALLETWRRRSSRTLTIEGYEESGGVRGAIAHTAEAVWNDDLTADQRPVARRIFLRLTELGEGTEDTRRRVARAELVSGSDAEATDDVLAALADARLVTVDDGTAEVAHEALIREWPRLRRWLDDDRDALRIHRHLTHSATDWDAVGRNDAELYRGPRLGAARDWIARDDGASLNELESEFLTASIALEDGERRAAEERATARERANRRLRRLVVGVAAALVVAVIAAVVALDQRNRADDQTRRARAASASAEVDRIVAEVPNLLGRDRTLATLLAVQASELRPDATTRGSLLSALTTAPGWRSTWYGGDDGYFRAAALAGNRRVVLIGRRGIDLWDLTTGRRLRSRPDASSAVAASPDGGRLATGTERGTVVVRSARTLAPTAAPIEVSDGAAVRDLAYSPSGDVLAVAVGAVESSAPIDASTAVRLWDPATGRAVGPALTGHTLTVNAVAFSPDGRLLATGGNDGLVVFHDPATGAPVGDPLSLGAPIYSLAFAPDGRELAIGAVHGTARVYDVASRQPRGAALPVAGELPSVVYDPSGTRLYTTANSAAQAYDARTLAPVGDQMDTQHGPPTVVPGPRDEVLLGGFDGTITAWVPDGGPTIAEPIAGSPPGGATFAPDGSTAVLAAFDDTVALYRTEGWQRLATLSVAGPGPRPTIAGATPAVFTRDGRSVFVGSRTGLVQAFDGRSGAPTGDPIDTGLGSELAGVALSPDGSLLAATSNTNAADGLAVVDLARRRAVPTEPPLPFALAATFRGDGRQFLVTSGVGGAAAYPVDGRTVGRGRLVAVLGPQAEVAAFSPAGGLLAVGSQNGKLRFHDARSLRPRRGPVAVSQAIVATLTYAAHGRTLAAQDTQLHFRLVDVRDRAPVGEPLPVAPIGFGSAGFAPDGRSIAVPDGAGTTVFDLDTRRWRRAACGLAGRDLTRAEWQRYLSAAGPYRATCRA